MAQIDLVCGRDTVTVDLDDDMVTVKQHPTLPLEPVADLGATVDAALAAPIDMPPLPELVHPGARVTIAFDDPTVLCFAPVWEETIPRIIEQLKLGGVKEKDITLICANGLHRQFPIDELERILGKDLVARFGERLLCHDGEDPDGNVDLGRTKNGYDVELNRLAVDTDLCIYLNASVWRAFNGGWKSVCVGLATYQSIQWHHTPDVMSMSAEKNKMHEILDEMGAFLEAKLGKRHFFKIETVLANPGQVAHMWAGSTQGTRQKALAIHAARGKARRDLLEEKVDVVCYGVPAWSPYATYATMNPLLTLVSTGLGYLGGVIEALGKPGCSAILATPCPDEWDEVHHPSYREIWNDVLPQSRDPYEIRDRFAAEYVRKQPYVDKYRYEFGFHPMHGIMATYPLKRLEHAARIYVAHAEVPALIEHLGFIPTATVNEAIAQARAIHGEHAKVALVQYPPAFNRM